MITRSEIEQDVIAFDKLIHLGPLLQCAFKDVMSTPATNQDCLRIQLEEPQPWSAASSDLNTLLAHRQIRAQWIMSAEGQLQLHIYLIPADLDGLESTVLVHLNLKQSNLAPSKRLHPMRALLLHIYVDGQPLLHQDLSKHDLNNAWDNAVQPDLVSEAELAELQTQSPDAAANIRAIQKKDGVFESMVKTDLLPYQRATVARMILRENWNNSRMDVTMSELYTEEGVTFYMTGDNKIKRHTATYDLPHGGILADMPGSGKTFTSLSLIAATKGQLAALNPDPVTLNLQFPIFIEAADAKDAARVRPGTLTENCLRKSASYSVHAGKEETDGQAQWNDWIRILKGCKLYYQRTRPEAAAVFKGRKRIGVSTRRSGQYSTHPEHPEDLPTDRIRLSATTLIVVPELLVPQWISEFGHFKKAIKEEWAWVKDGSGRSACGVKDANPDVHNAPDQLRYLLVNSGSVPLPTADQLAAYDVVLMSQNVFGRQSSTLPSPIMGLLWKRLIIDEGHFVSNTSNQTDVATSILAQSKWIISATPTQNLNHTEKMSGCKRRWDLHPRLGYVDLNKADFDDLTKFGKMAACLGMDPFREDSKIFGTAISRPFINGFGYKKLALALGQVVLRNSPQTVQSQMKLPPKTVEIVNIPFSCLDRLSYNSLLALVLVNLVDSEREGKDYLFAPRNFSKRRELMENIGEAHVFFGRGEHIQSVQDSAKHTSKLLAEHAATESGESCKCGKYNAKALLLLQEASKHLNQALGCQLWMEAAQSQDLAYQLSNCPPHLKHWSCANIASTPRLANDQSQLIFGDSIDQLDSALINLSRKLIVSKEIDKDQEAIQAIEERGDWHAREAYKSFYVKRSEHKNVNVRRYREPQAEDKHAEDKTVNLPESVTHGLTNIDLDASCSACVNWIINEVQESISTNSSERFIVFSQSAYTRAELHKAFSLACISNLYDYGGLATSQFDNFQKGKAKVLLMDTKRGGRGLDLKCASRIIFVEPLWARDLQTQAEHRSHRLGQTQDVKIQIVLMKDSFHAKMYRRREEIAKLAGSEGNVGALEDPTLASQLQQIHFIEGPEGEDLSTVETTMLSISSNSFKALYTPLILDPIKRLDPWQSIDPHMDPGPVPSDVDHSPSTSNEGTFSSSPQDQPATPPTPIEVDMKEDDTSIEEDASFAQSSTSTSTAFGRGRNETTVKAEDVRAKEEPEEQLMPSSSPVSSEKRSRDNSAASASEERLVKRRRNNKGKGKAVSFA